LYVTRILLDLLYYENKNIVIPEAVLECSSTYEDALREDLKGINAIANSGDLETITKCVIEKEFLTEQFKIRHRYRDQWNTLFWAMRATFYT